MQKTTEYTDQGLRQLFDKLPKEKLSPDFECKIMDRIRDEKAHRHILIQWLIWSSVGLATSGMIILMCSIFHYFSINLSDYFQDLFKLSQIEISRWTPYLFVGISALLLLFLDHQLRKFFHKSY